MKKKIISMIIIACLAVCLSVTALAESDFGYVSDSAYILSDNNSAELAARTTAISQKYNCDVYIVTIPDISEFGYYDIYSFGEAVFDQYHCGSDYDGSGIMLILNMCERGYALVTSGEYAKYAFSDYAKDSIAGNFVPLFAENDWYGGLVSFVNDCEYVLEQAANGTPINKEGYRSDAESTSVTLGKIAICIGLPCIIALIVCLVFKMQMRSVFTAEEASRYIAEKGVDLRISSDVYTHTTERRELVEPSDSESGSGSSGGGGKTGKF